MACPYFYPEERLSEKAWSMPPRLPLGDPYSGVCRVNPMREWRPDQATLRDCCNLGYARKRCPRFPKNDPGPDAVRFSTVGEHNGALRLYYRVEKQGAPFEHGRLEYSIRDGQFLQSHPSELVRKQAQAYVESYLRRKQHPQERARNPHRR